MKRLLVLSLLMLFCSTLFSQEENTEAEDSLGLSVFLAPFFETTSMVKQTNYIGGMGGVFVSENVIIGGFGKAMTSFFRVDSAYNEKTKLMERDLELDLGGGGLVFGYMFMPSKKIHPVIMLWTGGGSISLSDKTKTRIKDLYDDFFLFNGTFEIDYRPLKFLSLGVGVHYQMVSGLKLYGYTNNDFNGAGLFVNLKIGSFERD
ncbi:MAG: hypothetical protein HY951_14455 [Bacteroidia bacterium]|nr:hypothetical protein [Bacteroidia bacterium]